MSFDPNNNQWLLKNTFSSSTNVEIKIIFIQNVCFYLITFVISFNVEPLTRPYTEKRHNVNFSWVER